jgi:hypothetical protein
MEDEKVIRDEANDFFKNEIYLEHYNSINNFYKVKERLTDFYSSEHKAIFLDEIQKIVMQEHKNHIDRYCSSRAKFS